MRHLATFATVVVASVAACGSVVTSADGSSCGIDAHTDAADIPVRGERVTTDGSSRVDGGIDSASFDATHDATADTTTVDITATRDATVVDARIPCNSVGAAVCAGTVARLCQSDRAGEFWSFFDCAAIGASCTLGIDTVGDGGTIDIQMLCINACDVRGRPLSTPIDAGVVGLPCAHYECDPDAGDTRSSHLACHGANFPCIDPRECASLRCVGGRCAP